jgi:hypothetical protein
MEQDAEEVREATLHNLDVRNDVVDDEPNPNEVEEPDDAGDGQDAASSAQGGNE